MGAICFARPAIHVCLWLGVMVWIAANANSLAQNSNLDVNVSENPAEAVIRRLPDFFFTTAAYEREALRELVAQANRVAEKLNLPDKLPITTNSLIEVRIQPPASGAIGMISTTNYAYMVGYGRKFSGLDQRNMVKSFYEAKAKYTWPIIRLDTNGAFQMATQLLTTLSVDVPALNQNCKRELQAPTLEESGGTHFVPDYWVTWRTNGKVVAFIEFVEPSRTIRQFHVSDPKYILAKPITFSNLAELLNQPKTVPRTNAPAQR